MNRLKMIMHVCVLATVLTTLVLTAKVAEAAPLKCGTWSVVPSPNVGSGSNEPSAVAAISASNVWMVGYYQNSSNIAQTLIEHWNGTSWSVVPSPNAGSSHNYLYGVARVPGSSKVWAVGTFRSSSGIDQTLTEFYC
jgi:hypothetical protein